MPMNPFAPQPLQGVNYPSPEGYIDVDFTYVFDTNPALAIGELRQNQIVPLANDADFVWRATHYAYPDSTQLGLFRFRFGDGQGFYLSDAMIVSGNLSGFASDPTPLMQEIVFPHGGQVLIDLQNVDLAATSMIQICFRGVKRFRLGTASA